MGGKVRNICGAFADCAVLFPLLVLLGTRGYFSPMMLLGSAGLAYLLSGYYFQIPMPVQPLKSITVGALAIGASPLELRWSAGVLGLLCLTLIGLRRESILEQIPRPVIHQIQVGLGALLLAQAWSGVSGGEPQSVAISVALVAAALFCPDWRGVPWMGILAAFGMVLALGGSFHAVSLPTGGALGSPELRLGLIAGLVLPQAALTFTNSVAGTQVAAREYFPNACGRVSVRALCASIGLGNVLMAIGGGMPFCHGCGGLTAHVKGGATSHLANYMIGGFLLALAAVSAFRGAFPVVPPVFVFSLLFVTGIQHLRLARRTAKSWNGSASLVMAFGLALFTQNLLWVFCLALLLEGAKKAWPLPRLFKGET